jgi:glycosyltransferase involved in cell wall biosynthesis
MLSDSAPVEATGDRAADPAVGLRLVVVTTFFPNSSAPQRTLFVKNLVQAMRRQCQVLAVVAPVPYAPPFAPVPRWQAMRRVGAREQVDGVQVEHPRFAAVPGLTFLNGLGYAVSLWSTLRRLKRAHGRFLVHAHCAYPDGVGVALCARLLGLPYAITAHGSDINVYAPRASLKPQIRWALRGAAGAIGVSAAIKARLAALIGASRTTPALAHIPCAGFDPEVFGTVRTPPQGTPRSVIFVGHLVPIKGLPTLLKAWACLRRDAVVGGSDRLVIVGGGPERQALEQQAAAAGLTDSIVFTGPVPPAEVARRIAEASLLCLPSLNEGTPNVVVEALASGVPVVATRVGGVPDLVREGINGELVDPNDPERLAAAIAKVLAHGCPPAQVRDSVAHLTWSSLARHNVSFLGAVSASTS